MKNDKHKTKVIFRKFTDKESKITTNNIIAIFPELEYFDYKSLTKMSYMHIGQHGGCEITHINDVTTFAYTWEYSALKSELESIGYNLNILQGNNELLEYTKF